MFLLTDIAQHISACSSCLIKSCLRSLFLATSSVLYPFSLSSIISDSPLVKSTRASHKFPPCKTPYDPNNLYEAKKHNNSRLYSTGDVRKLLHTSVNTCETKMGFYNPAFLHCQNINGLEVRLCSEAVFIVRLWTVYLRTVCTINCNGSG